MSRHRSGPPPRHQARYGRVVVLTVSLLTTAVALLGGVGVLPSAADEQEPTDTLVSSELSRVVGRDGAAATTSTAARDLTTTSDVADTPDEPGPEPEPAVDPQADTTLPADSGSGRRIVFSEERQRVWLVADSGAVRRSYLVSGSLTDNLDPGTYEVYSRSKDAVGVDDSGTMKWFVRFTRGPSGAAIGFHTIPVDEGRVVQSRSQLGTPQSHGCIRQAVGDAKALWSFAPLGTTVVVV